MSPLDPSNICFVTFGAANSPNLGPLLLTIEYVRALLLFWRTGDEILPCWEAYRSIMLKLL